MARDAHQYSARLLWTGNSGTGTSRYDGYSRDYRISIHGKPDLAGSAEVSFRGRADAHNPEDHFLAAIAGCHMLSYLALCARRGVCVTAYEDSVHGLLRLEPDGGGAFEAVTLNPVVTIVDEAHMTLASALHRDASESCFIANSCRVAITHRPVTRTAPVQRITTDVRR